MRGWIDRRREWVRDHRGRLALAGAGGIALVLIGGVLFAYSHRCRYEWEVSKRE